MNKFFMLFAFYLAFLVCCRTSPHKNVKIIEERDPIVKNIEEKDSLRIITDTINNTSRKK